MPYKSLLTFVGAPGLAPAPLDTAMALARAEDAHLDIVCLGVDRSQADLVGFGTAAPVIVPNMLEEARDEAEELFAKVTARLMPEDIRWAAEQVVTPAGALSSVAGQRARYADLLIAAPPLGPRGGSEAEAIVEAALFDGHIPVLIVPNGAPLSLKALDVLIGWNDGDEALAAVRAALPILQSARSVRLVVIDPPVYGMDRSDPGGALAQMLARHGVQADIAVLAKSSESVAEVLLRQAGEQAANLIVMGAYGHSRLRETILGGATRDMLQKAKVPVFMAR